MVCMTASDLRSSDKSNPSKEGVTVTHQTGIAVIGCGNWGKNHVRVWASLGCLRVVCDTDARRLDEVRKSYPHVDTCLSFDAVLEREDVTGIVIATPASTHSNLTLLALQAGKDVLVEKPMALTVDEGRQMVETARRLGRILMVGHVLEYHPAVHRLQALIDEGALGRIQYIYSHLRSFYGVHQCH